MRRSDVLRAVDLDYELPEGLIATTPIEPRDAARLCVVGRGPGVEAGAGVVHRQVRDLPELLRAGDLLVLNTTSVLPAWLEGVRAGTGGRFNGLYLGPAPEKVRESAVGQNGRPFLAVWNVMLRGGHLRTGAVLRLEGNAGPSGAGQGVLMELLARDPEEPGAWFVGVGVEGGAATGDTLELLARVGLTPIPPYIRKARKLAGLDVADGMDRGRYQTVFADARTVHDGLGSVAAPTAGLHFTPGLLAALAERGVKTANVVLHVGSGTFRPVEVEVVEDHPIHSEWCSMTPEAIEAIRRTRKDGGRVICVGTTSARVVETFAGRAEAGEAYEEWVETRILITPGYRWRWVDGLLTNFHLPRSTLMAMVGALLAGGVEELKEVYAEAIRERYRFYSYGDAMLVVPGA